ncbi:uncharacterized protein K452DRAFT_309095 [Aplosporella prunicola CBS 121167]|uniref:Uncharacterized protein n=1 Tax=Aplosporella prunicola CBS 121167 TaxID=1176127 RepID=A0A6A6BD61_9PEZI|nr:uncharacterized protein K452DRAFT_309095 [Aplosporella prunicola CBS 121167]KAF2141313.1 hypothetical protein K452DRAFT_309095 [Aplosporella prunicola CBS 121167]
MLDKTQQTPMQPATQVKTQKPLSATTYAARSMSTPSALLSGSDAGEDTSSDDDTDTSSDTGMDTSSDEDTDTSSEPDTVAGTVTGIDAGSIKHNSSLPYRPRSHQRNDALPELNKIHYHQHSELRRYRIPGLDNVHYRCHWKHHSYTLPRADNIQYRHHWQQPHNPPPAPHHPTTAPDRAPSNNIAFAQSLFLAPTTTLSSKELEAKQAVLTARLCTEKLSSRQRCRIRRQSAKVTQAMSERAAEEARRAEADEEEEYDDEDDDEESAKLSERVFATRTALLEARIAAQTKRLRSKKVRLTKAQHRNIRRARSHDIRELLGEHSGKGRSNVLPKEARERLEAELVSARELLSARELPMDRYAGVLKRVQEIEGTLCLRRWNKKGSPACDDGRVWECGDDEEMPLAEGQMVGWFVKTPWGRFKKA